MNAIDTLGWALVHSLWQDALAAAGLASLLTLVPARAPRVRYALAALTLAVMLTLPLATALRVDAASDAAMPALAAPALTSLVDRISAGLEPTLPWFVALWLGGVLVMSARLASGWAATRRLATARTRPVPEAWRQALARLARQLRVSRPVRLLASALIEVPAMIGWWRPVILIPVSVLAGGGLTPLQLDALLAHELAHVRRHDYLVNLLQTVVETLLFYHPAVWWVSTRVREEREHCCDDLAVAACGDARVYATALLEMEQLRAAPALALGAGGGSLLGRVRRLLAPATPDASPRWLAGVVGGALALAVAIGSSWGLHRSLPASADSPIALATGSHDPDVRHDVVKELRRAKDARTLRCGARRSRASATKRRGLPPCWSSAKSRAATETPTCTARRCGRWRRWRALAQQPADLVQLLRRRGARRQRLQHQLQLQRRPSAAPQSHAPWPGGPRPPAGA